MNGEMSPQPQYNSVSKMLHWLVVVLLIVEFTLGWTMPELRRGMTPETLVNLHMSFGVLILLVVVARFIWRFFSSTPPHEKPLAPWQSWLSLLTHYGLYVLLVLLPLTGWIYASTRGWSVSLFNLIPLPGLVSTGSTWGRAIGGLHSMLATLILLLIGLHVAAALYHWFLKDGVMERMLPRNWSKAR